MTISTTTTLNRYTGNNATTVFPFTYRILAATDLVVTKLLSGTLVPSTLSYPADYSVSGVGNATGGSITMTVAPATGDLLVIERVMPITQPTSIRNNGSYFAETHENVFDRGTMVDQQQASALARTFSLPKTIDPATLSMSLPVPVAGQVLAWTPTGLTNASVSNPDVVLPGEGRDTSTLSQYLANNYVYNVLDYDADPTGVTDSATAIDAALAAIAASTHKGVLFFPAGSYLTSGSHAVGDSVYIQGSGSANTTITHSGNNTCFTAATTNIFTQRGFSGFTLAGNSGSSAIGISYSHGYRGIFADVLVKDYSAGIGIRLKNQVLGGVGSGLWTEGLAFIQVHVRGCLQGWQFTRDTSDANTASFSETRFVACSCVLSVANAIGVNAVDTGVFIYGGSWNLKFNVSSTGCTCIKIGAGALAVDNLYALYAEITSGSATRLNVGNASSFYGHGDFPTSVGFSDVNGTSAIKFFGQRTGELTVGGSGEYHVKTASSTWLAATADADLVVAFCTAQQLTGRCVISWSGASRYHEMVIEVMAKDGDSAPVLSILRDKSFGGQRVFGTPKIQRLSAGGNTPHLVIPVSNRGGVDGDIRASWTGTRSFPYQLGLLQGAAGGLAAADTGAVRFQAADDAAGIYIGEGKDTAITRFASGAINTPTLVVAQSTPITKIWHGQTTLVAGTKVVNTSPATNVTANSRIFLGVHTPGGTPGWLQVSARTASTSFTILSSSGTDTSVVDYLIIEP